MRNFLSNFPLYKESVIVEDFGIGNEHYYHPGEFVGETFEYFCEEENSITTFELELENSNEYAKSSFTRIPEELFIDDKLNFTFFAIGKCKSCMRYQVYFLLNVFSDKPISDILNNYRNITLSTRAENVQTNTNIIIKKVGCQPQANPIINKKISKYFCRESSQFYYKGVKALNDNYGVGSFAYFRRIIEKELIKIIEDIKSLPDSDKEQIQILLDEHYKNPAISTIYDNIFQYLPNSLKILGDNPIKLLYNQTSQGLHNLTEEECLNKSQNILTLLEFVITRIYEEKSIIKDIKDIIKNLK